MLTILPQNTVNYAGNLVWEEEDEITTDISDAGLVTALEFIQHPTLTLLIAHAQAGFTCVHTQTPVGRY